MVKIASAPPSKFETGSLDAIKSNRSGLIWNLKAGETTDKDDCGPRKDFFDNGGPEAVVISPEGGKKATKSNTTNTYDTTSHMDKKSYSIKKIDGRGTGSPNADGARKVR